MVSPSLYPSLLGSAWRDLAPSVQRLHAEASEVHGVLRVRRGEGRIARLLGYLLGLPRAGDRVAVSLSVARSERAERWSRSFEGRPMHTTQWAQSGLMVEACGLVQFWFRLRAEHGGILFEQQRVKLGLRGFTFPLP